MSRSRITIVIGKEREVDNAMNKVLRHILITVAVIVVVVLLIVLFSKLLSNRNNNSLQAAGISGVVSLDGNAVGVFQEQAEAEANKVTVDAGIRTLSISGSGNIDVRAMFAGNWIDILTQTKGNNYDLDLTGVGNASTIILRFMVGGDGSFTSQRLSGNVKTYYLALDVNNPNQNVETAKSLGVPNGKIYFGEDAFFTYGSESEAYQAALDNPIVIPTYMVHDGISIKAEPDEGTYRIHVTVSAPSRRDGPMLWSANDFAGVIDVSEFAGQQITLMIHAENDLGFVHGFSYLSFSVPEVETTEEASG